MRFKKEDIKVGYMVEIAVIGERYIRYFCTAIMWNGYMIFTNGDDWWKLSDFNDNLESSFYKITKVWGYPEDAECVLHNEVCDRPLLWERPWPKKMTKAEIEKILGYEIEIVE